MEHPLDPENCNTMLEVRAGVDAVDAALIALIAKRFGYMRAAARIKPERDQVRDEVRKAQVIANATAAAERLVLPVRPIAALWNDLIEASITYEYERFDER